MRNAALQWHQKVNQRGPCSRPMVKFDHGSRVRGRGAFIDQKEVQGLRGKSNLHAKDWDLLLEATWAQFDQALARNTNVIPDLLSF